METFGDWLGRELKRRGMRQADLARESGLKTATISRLVNQVRLIPEDETCQKIAKAFGLPVEEVYRYAGKLPTKQEMREAVERLVEIAATLSDDEIEELTYIALGKQRKIRR